MNLVSDPWLPVINGAGQRRATSLEQTLLSAHRIRGIAGATPLETVAILRLLLAVLYRAAQPDTERAAVRMLKRRQFPARDISRYLAK